MSDIKRILGVKEIVVASLKESGIESIDDLWMCVGADFDSGITRVSQIAKVGENLVTALLIAESLDQLKIKHTWLSSFRNNHRLAYRLTRTFLFLFTIATLGYASYLVLPTSKLPRQVIVAAPQGIPAYHTVGKEDLALRTVLFQSPNTFSDPGMIVGSFTLTDLAPNTIVVEDHILSASNSSEVRGSYIVSVPIKPNALRLTPKAGTHLSLLISSQQIDNQGQAFLPIDVVLLGVERKGDASNLVIAVNDVEKIEALVRASNIVVVEQLK